MKETLHTFRSFALGNERPVWVRRPGGGAKATRLVVFLDGEFFRDRIGACAILEELEAGGAIEPCVVVFFSMHHPDSRWVECPCHPPFATCIADEFLTWLAQVEPATAALTQRVLIGLSYTGLAAAWVALERPGLFDHVIAQSGSFWWNDCWLPAHVRSMDTMPRGAYHLSVGVRETQENVQHKEDLVQVVSQITGVRAFRDAVAARGGDVTYVELDGAHEFTAWARALPEALCWAVGAETAKRRP